MSSIAETLHQIRVQNPLVHNITNYVVMNNTANALLAIGASPVMAHALEEIKDIVAISSSLVLNMGTLSEKWVESMVVAAIKANETKTTFVFDPVGVGASKFRTESAQKIMEAATPDVIRGNASEIMALAKLTEATKGVDSTIETHDAVEGAIMLAKKLNNTIVISGAIDYIITGDTICKISNGSPLMSKITGMGCTATAIVGACIAVEKDIHLAATSAMAIMGVAGDMAKENSEGPGSFQMNFIDCLYQLNSESLEKKLQIDD
jgi:hydroxyethylthiazole kinase